MLDEKKSLLVGSYLAITSNILENLENVDFFEKENSSNIYIMISNELNSPRFCSNISSIMKIRNIFLEHELVCMRYYTRNHVTTVIFNINENYIVFFDPAMNLADDSLNDIYTMILESIEFLNLLVIKKSIKIDFKILVDGPQSNNWFCSTYSLAFLNEISKIKTKKIKFDQIEKIINKFYKENVVCDYVKWFYEKNHKKIYSFDQNYSLLKKQPSFHDINIEQMMFKNKNYKGEVLAAIKHFKKTNINPYSCKQVKKDYSKSNQMTIDQSYSIVFKDRNDYSIIRKT